MTARRGMSWLLATPEQEVAVVIPTYRSVLDSDERKSLSQCIKVLGSYPIIFVAPLGLELAPEIRQLNNIQVIRFPAHYFAGIAGYNALMLSPAFYQAFSEFRYILIHQLDVFVFRDALSEWCRYDFDYVGAPWEEDAPWIAGGVTRVLYR